MRTLNTSSECCELSWKHNCTLECAAGIKMAAPHSLPVAFVYACTLHIRYKSVAMHRFRLMIHI